MDLAIEITPRIKEEPINDGYEEQASQNCKIETSTNGSSNGVQSNTGRLKVILHETFPYFKEAETQTTETSNTTVKVEVDKQIDNKALNASKPNTLITCDLDQQENIFVKSENIYSPNQTLNTINTSCNTTSNAMVKQGVPNDFSSSKVSSVLIKREVLEDNTLKIPEISLYLCLVCDKQFFSPCSLRAHEAVHDIAYKQKLLDKQKQQEVFTCKLCKKDYTGSRLFKKHMKKHNDHKPFECMECDKDFADYRLLQGHRAVHSNKKPFTCTICKKAFKYLGNLRVHARYHETEKMYKCQTCQKSFFIARDLRRHVRVHTGDRRYHCEECKKSFFDAQSLKRHSVCHSKTAANAV